MKDTYLVYDLEALRAIPKKNETIIPGVEYCNGFTDYAGIGISVLVAWMSQTGRYNVYQKDNLHEFEAALKEVDYVIGFNHIKFDNQVVEAAGLTFPETVKHYDILRELWIADGLDPDKFSPSTHGGYSLDACTSVNFKTGKTMDGYMAPIEYQQGNVSKVINYCIADVDLTCRLFEKIMTDGYLWHPKYPGTTVTLKSPFKKEEFVI